MFNNIAVGTTIRILEQPVKMSYEKDGKKIELHSPLTPDGKKEAKLVMTDAVRSFIGDDQPMIDKVNAMLDKPQGIVISLK